MCELDPDQTAFEVRWSGLQFDEDVWYNDDEEDWDLCQEWEV